MRGRRWIFLALCWAAGAGLFAAETAPWRLGPEWAAFIDDGLDETMAAKLESVPETMTALDGRAVAARRVVFHDGVADLNDALGAKRPEQSRAVLVNTFDADADGPVRIGAGADWWFDCFVNGEYVYGTAALGNIAFPVTPGNHVFDAPARRGRNLIVLFVESGRAGWTVACAPAPPGAKTSLFAEENRFSPRRAFNRQVGVRGRVPPDSAREADRIRHAERRRMARALFPPRAAVLHGPWLMHPNPGEITVVFVTDGSVPAGVDVREAGAEAWRRVWDARGGQVRNDTAIHRVRLAGLAEGVRHEYRLVLLEPRTNRELVLPETHGFAAGTRAPAAFRLFVTGDTQFSPRIRTHFLQSLLREEDVRTADFFVTLGDVSNAFDDFAEEHLFGLLDPWLAAAGHGKPYVAVRGNHELRGDEAGRWFSHFGRAYGGFRQGDVYYLALDAGEDQETQPYTPHFTGRTLAHDDYMRGQKAWLDKAVTTEDFASAKFRVVLAHGAPYSHGDTYMARTLRRLTDDLFAGESPRHRIHLWLSGHKHVYRRTVPGQRVVFSNTKPEGLRPEGEMYPYTVVTLDGPGFGGLEISALLMTAEPERLVVESLDAAGERFDHFTLDASGRLQEQRVGDGLQRHVIASPEEQRF